MEICTDLLNNLELLQYRVQKAHERASNVVVCNEVVCLSTFSLLIY